MHLCNACILKEWHICIQFLASDDITLICILLRNVGHALLGEKDAIIVVQNNQETISFQQQIFQPTFFSPFNYLANTE